MKPCIQLIIETVYTIIMWNGLVGSIISGGAGGWIKSKGGMTTKIMQGTMLISWWLMYEVWVGEVTVTIRSIELWKKERMTVSYNKITIMMVTLISTISYTVQEYGRDYLKEEPDKNRFYSILSMFTWWMIIMVISENWIGLLIGWEGVGFKSMILISYWTTRKMAIVAGLKAIIMNRLCDTMMMTWLGMLMINYGTLKIEAIKVMTTERETKSLGWLVMIAAGGKSAQIFVHTWLVDAMEGPTPVSALLHAATMVEKEHGRVKSEAEEF